MSGSLPTEPKHEAPFLKRWSQRKLAAAREPATPPATIAPSLETPGSSAEAAARALPAAPGDPAAPPSLPAVDSLTFDSDFTAFFKPNVDEALKRSALRKLFADPRFNVMDGLDVYIDDYTKFVPMTPEIVAQLNHAKFLFDPPKTRVNAQGYVEDVPDEAPATAEESANAADAESAADAPPPPIEIVDQSTNVPAVETAQPELLPLAQPPEETR